ncbi:MAG: UDP-N-acetylmuramate--L-alanine ligase [Bdellovibrionota bacterium]
MQVEIGKQVKTEKLEKVEKLNLSKLKKIHFVGIGGSAISAVARLLFKNNIKITGSDASKNAMTESLSELGIKIFDSQVKENLRYEDELPDLVLISPALIFLDPNNEEILYAKEKNIRVLTWQEFLGDYLDALDKFGLITCGSEGKGTTCSFLKWILKGTKYDPLTILGANLKDINEIGKKSNVYEGSSNTYILEGDEFNKNFHNYHPHIVMMVNFQYEHPEFYKNFDEYKKSFYEFFCGMKGDDKTLIFRATENMVKLVKEYDLEKTHKIIWYKNSDDDVENNVENNIEVNCDYIISNVSKNGEKGIKFMLETPKGSCMFNINAFPYYLANNSTAAIICAMELGLSLEEIWTNIQRFNGIERRFDVYKFGKNGTIITDYGHSPSSIRQVVKEAREFFPNKKLHLVFQPHLFSRTYNFFDELISELSKADKVSLVDVYPARERKEDWEDKIHSKMLVDKLNENNIDAEYIGEANKVHEALLGKVNDGETTLFMGAGDMDKSYKKLFAKLEAEN